MKLYHITSAILGFLIGLFLREFWMAFVLAPMFFINSLAIEMENSE